MSFCFNNFFALFLSPNVIQIFFFFFPDEPSLICSSLCSFSRIKRKAFIGVFLGLTGTAVVLTDKYATADLLLLEWARYDCWATQNCQTHSESLWKHSQSLNCRIFTLVLLYRWKQLKRSKNRIVIEVVAWPWVWTLDYNSVTKSYIFIFVYLYRHNITHL